MPDIVEISGELPWTERKRWLYPSADIGTIDWPFRYHDELDVDIAIRRASQYQKGSRNCIQAGGCIGIWPIRLAQVFDMVYTFEAEPTNYKCLTGNTYGIDNIACTHAALGNSNNPVSMHLEGRFKGHCGAWFAKSGGNIPMVRIDDLGLDDVDFIWLDIEGGESDALLGAMETIRRCQPVIGFEQREFTSRYKVAKPSKIMLQMGYREVGNVFGHDYLMVPG